MSHFINENCQGCKDTGCTTVCPVDCIHPRKDSPEFEGADQLYIDPSSCIDCGLCVPICPAHATARVIDATPETEKYIKINADHYR